MTYYIKPEMNGRTRYVYFKGDEVNDVLWGDTPEEVAEAAGIVLSEADIKAGLTAKDMVKSFTMFTGEASDTMLRQKERLRPDLVGLARRFS